MENEYELYHHGIKGQKWGIRRFQNKDGTWTAEGKKKKNAAKKAAKQAKNTKTTNTTKSKSSSNTTTKKKSVHDMSDDELADYTKRLRAEKDYLQLTQDVAKLTPKQVSTGKKIADHIVNKIVVPAVTTAAKDTMTSVLKKQGEKLFKVKIEDSKKKDKKDN